MLERFKLLLKLEEKEGVRKRIIRHLALTTQGIRKWSIDNKKDISEGYKQAFVVLKEITELQIKNNIPILTVYLLPEELSS